MSSSFPVTFAHAQEEAALIQEVVVSAQRRDESLQDVPVTVNAFTSDIMQQLRITNTKDIVAYTPGMSVKGIFNDSGPEIYLRGVGSSTFRSVAISPVAIYSDHVYLGNHIAHGFQLFDIERIEVLKGPQGTLYGRNTTGGLVNYISRKPDVRDGTNGNVSFTYGNYDERLIDAAAGVAVGETLALRVAAQSRQRDGMFRNENPASGYSRDGALDWSSYRVQARYTPNDAWDVLLKIQHAASDSETLPRKVVGIDGAGCNPLIIGNAACRDLRGYVHSGDWYGTASSFRTLDAPEFTTSALTVNYRFGDYTLTSTTGHLDGERAARRDTDQGPLDVLNSVYDDDVSEFSQELRLANDPNARLSWQAGWYYFESDYDTLLGLTMPDSPGMWSFLTDRNLGVVPPTFGSGEEGMAIEHHAKTESWAVFLDGKYAVTDRFNVTAGVRWTEDKREVLGDTFLYDATGLRGTFHDLAEAQRRFMRWATQPGVYADKWSDLAGRVVLDYELTQNLMIWGGVSHGFKGGEFNIGTWPANGIPIAGLTEPEYLTDYEGGVKSVLLNGALTVNASVFQYDFQDMQVFTYGPLDPTDPNSFPGTQLRNAGEATIRGVELEAAFAPTPRWLLRASLGLYRGEYDQFFGDATVTAGGPGDYSGNELPNLPELTASTYVRYRVPLGNGARVDLQADYVYQDAAFVSEENSVLESRPSYDLLGARVEYTTRDARWSVAIWAKNLLEEKYFIDRSVDTITREAGYTMGEPRTYGLTGLYRFGP